MRDLLNKIGIPIVILALIIAGVLFFNSNRKPDMPSTKDLKAFYIDEETGQESTRIATDVPPLLGAGGKPTVVQAIKYTCDGGKTVLTAYWQKYTPEGKEALEKTYKTNERPDINIMEHLLVRSPDKDAKWVSAQSDEGQRLMSYSSPDGARAEAVQPH